jgi:glycosyltransferase involved in cell wall biosynthesis
MESAYTFVLPIGPQDIERASLIWYASYDIWVSKDVPILIICPEAIMDDVRATFPQESFQYISDEDLFDAYGNGERRDDIRTNNWSLQQYIKLLASHVVTTPFYVLFDSDVFFKRKVTSSSLIKNGKILTQMHNPLPSDRAWYNNAYMFLYPKVHERVPQSYTHAKTLPGVTPQSMHTKTVREMFKYVSTSSSASIPQLFSPKGMTEYAMYYVYAMEMGSYNNYHYSNGLEDLCPMLNSETSYSAFTFSDFLKFDVKGMMKHHSICSLVQSNLRIPADVVADMVRFLRRELWKNIHAPLVTCMMITKDRLEYAKIAIRDFIAQTYTRKELLIVTDSQDGTYSYVKSLDRPDITVRQLPSESRTLGELRNYAVQEARGIYVIQWDDDDLYHPSRISVQMLHLLENQAVGCFMREWLMAWPSEKRYAVSYPRDTGWEGTGIIRKDVYPIYPKERLGEDTVMMMRLWKNYPNDVIVIDGYECLYIYRIHARNSWGRDHAKGLFDRSTPLKEHYISDNVEDIGRAIAGKLNSPYEGYSHEESGGRSWKGTIIFVCILLLICLLVWAIWSIYHRFNEDPVEKMRKDLKEVFRKTVEE